MIMIGRYWSLGKSIYDLNLYVNIDDDHSLYIKIYSTLGKLYRSAMENILDGFKKEGPYISVNINRMREQDV